MSMKENVKQNILITGGAGYIGTNIIAKLISKNVFLVVIDDFSNSYKSCINNLMQKFSTKIKLIEGNFGDEELLKELFSKYQFSAVIHLAAKKYVAESFKIPEEYTTTNVEYTKTLLKVMKEFNVKKIVFPSSIAVYGQAVVSPTPETEQLNPLSVYAETKVCGEELIQDWAKSTNSNYTILRLSNPIGANIKFNCGDNSTNIYSNLMAELNKAITSGSNIVLNGNDHNTKDGTAVRDFIHVKDVADAFILALTTNTNGIFNIGYGNKGFSVLDIIKKLETITSKKLNYKFGPKRQGDVSIFISNNNKAKRQLNFKVKNNLTSMVESCYKFYVKNKLDN